MNSSIVKTSLLIPSQLPEWIRDDPNYQNFVLFLQSYYEWMEESGNALDYAKNIPSYMDIDSTTDQFMEYFSNDFLQYFPQDLLISKSKAIKLAKELYQSKGTPASFRLLFRILYNSDLEYYYNRDQILKASDGIWYIPKSVRVNSENPNLLNINNYRLLGETSKTIATIESSVRSGNKTEIFISNITRLFQSGEYVRVVDSNNQDVLFNGDVLRAKIVGQISRITIDPKNRGLLYDVGDPVILYDGITSSNGIGAIAEVGSITEGSLQNITLSNGGYGYTESPNSIISISGSSGAIAVIGSIDPTSNVTSNVTLFTIDTLNTSKNNGSGLIKYAKIGDANYYLPTNPSANVNTPLSQALTFKSFNAYPISSVTLLNSGGGLKSIPNIEAVSRYPDNSSDSANNFAFIKNLGILAPIQIANGGEGYQINDTIIFTNGSGYGAYANVTNVSTSGAITEIKYVSGPKQYSLGGMGYRSSALPTISVASANVLAHSASLSVPGILGDGATFESTIDKIGSIGAINVIDPGQDYTSQPLVSLKVQDIVVSNVSILHLPQKGDIIYQGSDVSVASYSATVNSISILQSNGDHTQSLYNLRVFNYNSKNKSQKPVFTDGNIFVANNNVISMVMANTAYNKNYDATGVITYGDGKAKASASFLNGLVISEGTYLNEQGQPSSYNVLQSDVYNNFTYQITVEKEIAKYREMLLNLLHPTGMKIIGRYALKSNTNNLHTGVYESLYSGIPLDAYTGYTSSGVTMSADFNNMSNNIIKFTNLAGANIANFIFAGTSTIEINPTIGMNVRSEIVSVDGAANTAVIKNNVWLTFANVALISAYANSNVINITSVTDSYDLVNNGEYSNTMYPIKDIVFSGDIIKIANNTNQTVNSVDYINGKIYLTSNLSSNSNSYLSVNRTLTASDGKVIIFGPIGVEYTPELTTENGLSITTEDGKIIILG